MMKWQVNAEGEFFGGPVDGFIADETVRHIIHLGIQIVVATGVPQVVRFIANGHLVQVCLEPEKLLEQGDADARSQS